MSSFGGQSNIFFRFEKIKHVLNRFASSSDKLEFSAPYFLKPYYLL